MIARLILTAVTSFALGAAAAAAYLTSPFAPDRGLSARATIARAFTPVRQVVTGKALIGGPFSLLDHTGKRVTQRDFLGRHTLVFFGFTFCPDACPAGLQVMTEALNRIGPKAKRVTPLFISVDPERDTPVKLAEYVQSFHPSLVGLTGTPEEVAQAAKSYRAIYKKVADEKSKARYTIDHTTFFYLMDANGEFVTHFTHTTTPQALAERLDKAL